MDRQIIVRELSLVAVLSLVLLAALFALLPLDHTISTNMQHLANPVLDLFLTYVSIFGGAPVEASLVIGALAILIWRQRSLEAWFLLATTASAGTIGTILRFLIRRQRPTTLPNSDLLWQLVAHYSFPSGHTFFYTAFFGSLAFLFWKRYTGRARWLAIAICLALIILVGPSRVFLGAHWPSDVAGGYLVGGVCLSAVIMYYQWRYRW
jgi:undecaprenyl-diphosphatase